jgi:hypothetical protein
MMMDQALIYIAIAISIVIAVILTAWPYFRLRADLQRATKDAMEQTVRTIMERNAQSSNIALQNVVETIDYPRVQENEPPTEDLVDRIKREQEDGRSTIGQKRKRDRYEVVRV